MTDIDPIMQAAERLRRCVSEPWEEVYKDDDEPLSGVELLQEHCRDKYALADFALSILPKGKRPVAKHETHGFETDVVEQVGTLWYFGREGYETEVEANLARQWQRFDELIAASR